MTDYRERLKGIRTFPMLVRFLRDELQWPIDSSADFEDLTFQYTPEELGIDAASAASIEEIKQLRRLSPNQPWGVFFIKFEPKRLPVVALRRILGRLAVTKRATSGAAERPHWSTEDLLFISNYGDGDERKISFAHFSQDPSKNDLPTLKVLAWDDLDTPLHLEHAANTLVEKLAWPKSDDESNTRMWGARWRSAFELEHREVVTTSKVLAVRLAALARRIRSRIRSVLEIETPTGPLTQLMAAFRGALIHDLDPDDFADMYAQTIAYGLLSARIAEPKADGASDLAAHLSTSPFLRELMESFLHVGGSESRRGPAVDFDELGAADIVALLKRANFDAVLRDFGDRNPLDDPVIHFYELFLKEYDAKKRMQRGVFYTPRPVVSYIVRSVDERLRSDFGLEDGLADTVSWAEMVQRHKDLEIPAGIDPSQDFVQILDPATGTGTFLVEAIDLIYRRLTDKWEAEGRDGEEVLALWNDYVPEHLLPRLHGFELLMAPYAIAHLKVGLKLYETRYRFGSGERVRIYLTNALEPPHDFSSQFDFAIPALAHEAQAVSALKAEQRFTVVIGNPPYSNVGQLNRIPFILNLLGTYKRGLHEKKLNLDDDFIKFVRFAHYVLERTGAGCLGLITNNVYLDGATHRGMRKSLIQFFSRIEILNLLGSARKGDKAPDGSPDENVFDIQQGVGIAVLSTGLVDRAPQVLYAELRGTREYKYRMLRESQPVFERLTDAQLAASASMFVPQDLTLSDEYERYASMSKLFSYCGQGIQTKQDAFALQKSPEAIREIVTDLERLPAQTLSDKYDIPVETASWSIAWAKKDVHDHPGELLRIAVAPFDWKWTYYTGHSNGFLARPRRVSTDMMRHGNIAIIAKRQTKELDFSSVYVVNCPANEGIFAIDPKGRETLFPLYGGSADTLLDSGDARPANLAAYVALPAESFFWYMYAILHSSTYRRRYAGYLLVDYPRIPMPSDGPLFQRLTGLGGELVALHLMESPTLDDLITTYLGPTSPKVQRIGWSDNTVWLDVARKKTGQLTTGGTIGFRGISQTIWNFRIGGYQVCEKWLKDRTGLTLSETELGEYQQAVVAIAETIRLMREIDEVIEQHGGWPTAFEGHQGRIS